MIKDRVPLDAEHFYPFLNFLRTQHGFDLGVDQYLAVRDLLLALVTAGRNLHTIDEVVFSLGPILCSNPEQQASLGKLFREWLPTCPELLAHLGQTTSEVNIEPAETAQQAQSKAVIKSGVSPWWWGSIPLALGVIFLVVKWIETGSHPVKPEELWQRPSEIHGWVEVRGQPGARVAGARVAFLKAETTTAADGSFRFGVDPAGKERGGILTISHPDYSESRYYLDLKGPAKPWTYLLDKVPEPVTLGQVSLRRVIAEINAVVDALETPRPAPWQQFMSRWYWPLRLLLVGMFLLVWLAILYRNWSRGLTLRQESVAADPHREPVRVARTAVKLFASDEWRMAARELRRHLQIPSSNLDIEATLKASAASGGLFSPVYHSHAVSPEYLVLVDRASFDDHHARLAERQLARFAESGNYLEICYFRGSPQLLQGVSPPRRMLTLTQAAATFSRCRLILLSDGAPCFSQFTGVPEPWLALLERWEERAWVTPLAEPSWGPREKYLQKRGFLVFPATALGFSRLASLFHGNSDGSPQRRASPQAPPYPRLLQQDTRYWTRASPPTPTEQKRLIGQVRAYLGNAGWVWFRACAAFPVIFWELTLFLGLRLQWLDRPLFDENRLARLSALPWFTLGKMPVWLRRRLVDELDIEEKRRLRGLMVEWMRRPAGKEDGFALPIAEPNPSRKFRRFRKARPPKVDAYNDSIALALMEGEREVAFAFKLPPLVRRLLYRHGNPLLGLRPLPLMLLALILIFILVKPFPARNPVSYIPRFSVAQRDELEKSLPIPEGISTYFGVSEQNFEEYERRWRQGFPPGNPSASGSLIEAIESYLRERGIGEATKVLGASAQRSSGPIFLSHQIVENLNIEMVWCPPDEFLMGSPGNEPERRDDETQHKVTLTKGFWLGQTAVTQAQWKAVMGDLPDGLKTEKAFLGDQKPVVNVSWDNAQVFIKKLNDMIPGGDYRLPTEAEWEYACRAGTRTRFSFGDRITTDQVNYHGDYPPEGSPKGTFRETTVAVKSLPGNAWGLHEMHGNVWEWCQDWYGGYLRGEEVDPQGAANGVNRVLRGGSWIDYGWNVRSACRNRWEPGNGNDSTGFRLARGQVRSSQP